MTNRILLRGGHVLTMDPNIGDLSPGDVLIEDDKIAAVDRTIEADAEVVDCTGLLVTPFSEIRKVSVPPDASGADDE